MNDTYLTGASRIVLAIALSLATFLIVLDYSIANVAIPYISGDLAVSANQGTYIITSFAVGSAIGLPLTNWLTKRIGSVRLMITSLLLFTLFSGLCGAASTFPLLITFRFLQGLVAGPLVPLSQTLIITTNPPEKRTPMLALWSTVVIVGPLAGPLLGGWISFDYTWPWIFYINLPVGLLSAGIIWFFLHNKETPIIKEPLDWVGLLLLAIGLSCLQVFLDRGEQFDWLRSPWMRILATTSLISITLLILWSLNSKKPLLELRLFKISSYSISVILLIFMYSIYFGTIVLIPLWLQENMGYNAIWAGLAVCPIGLAPLILSKLLSKIVSKYGSVPPLAIGASLFAISCFYTAYFDTNVDVYHIGFSRFLLGMGIAFFIIPLFSLSVQDLSRDQLASGTGTFHLVRAMIGGTGTSVFTTLWIRRSAYHHQVLGESVTPFSSEWISYRNQLAELGIEGKKALALFNTILSDQAAMLGLNDCFYLMGWIFLGLIPLLIFAKKKQSAVAHQVKVYPTRS